MIKIDGQVKEATCDACKRSLIDPEEPHNTNYGLLRTHFGYGSRLDDLSEFHGPNDKHLCEDCWEKALAAVGLLIHDRTAAEEVKGDPHRGRKRP